MKNILKKVLLVALAALMLVSLVSCDKSGAVKKAFEKEEYEVKAVKYEDLDSITKGILELALNDDQEEKIAEYELIICKKGLDSAVVIKFPSAGDVKDFLTVEKDGEKNTEAYDKAKEEGVINGNCMIITGASSAKDIFKKA